MATEFEFDDLQGLLRYGYGHLPESCFLLVNVTDDEAAKRWLRQAPVTHAGQRPADRALHVAFSPAGLRALGLPEAVLGQFSEEFLSGMAGDANRSRRLGDVGANAPANWDWGGDPPALPHLLLLLYAETGRIDAWRRQLEDEPFRRGFQVVRQLPTRARGTKEPFGFEDGISQPKIDWRRRQTTRAHDHDGYSNRVAIGEMVLGYPNEYGLYTLRPLLDPQTDSQAALLPHAEDRPQYRDLGRNGTYLVLRQLAQDVPGFWRFLVAQSGDLERAQALAATLVGRKTDGTPLVEGPQPPIPGTPDDSPNNRFTFDNDPRGQRCPLGAHIRRANPRTGDQMPGGKGGWFGRLQKIFGFAQGPEDDLVAPSRFHRILRRGRAYGPSLTPREAVEADATREEQGLQFICLGANLARQFEFVQNAWVASSKFNGVQLQQDPLLGNREPLLAGERTDQFSQADPAGPRQVTCPLPRFVTVRGGAYFFLPGLRALRYLASLPSPHGESR